MRRDGPRDVSSAWRKDEMMVSMWVSWEMRKELMWAKRGLMKVLM